MQGPPVIEVLSFPSFQTLREQLQGRETGQIRLSAALKEALLRDIALAEGMNALLIENRNLLRAIADKLGAQEQAALDAQTLAGLVRRVSR